MTLRPLLCALALATAGAAAHANEPIVLKVHHFLNTTSIQHTRMLRGWCDAIARDSANRLQCQIFPAMQLGGTPPQLFEQAKSGVADVVWTLPGSTPGRFPKIEVFELPFIMGTAEATSAAAWDFYEKHATDEFKDVKVLAIHSHGPGVVFTTKKPVKTLEDLKGLKLRGPTRLTTKLVGAIGAAAVGMPLPGVPDAMSKGVIDGAITTYEIAPSIKLDELAKYVAETDPGEPGLYTALFVMPMNKARYDSLPPDLQKVIDKHSGRALSIQFGKMMGDNDVPGRARMNAAQASITVLPKAEVARWKKASEHIDDEWVADINKRGGDGKALLAEARALIVKNSK